MKKRILAFMMAAAMVFGSSTAVMAAGEGQSSAADTMTVTIKKNYQVNGADGAQSPAETFQFKNATLAYVAGTKYNDGKNVNKKKKVEDSMGIPADVRTITITGPSYIEGDTTRDRDITTAVITAAKYDSVGSYIYTFKETAGKTAGVTYDSNTYELYVNVVYGDTAGTYKIGGAYVKKEGKTDKVQEIVNTYQSGNLQITKKVTGNMGDKSKVFDVNVTLTVADGKTVKAPVTIATTDVALTNPTKIDTGAWNGNQATVRLHVKDGITVELKNLPVGVSYTVAEENYSDYTTSYTQDGKDIAGAPTNTAVRENAIDIVTITNDKNVNVDTGVIVSNLPYILILAAVAGGLVLFAAGKKHRADED